MQVSLEDLAELVGRERRFDLLAVGLQEVPRSNVARLLQSALDETHRYVCRCNSDTCSVPMWKESHEKEMLEKERMHAQTQTKYKSQI